jgi:hypothetical protein
MTEKLREKTLYEEIAELNAQSPGLYGLTDAEEERYFCSLRMKAQLAKERTANIAVDPRTGLWLDKIEWPELPWAPDNKLPYNWQKVYIVPVED